MKRFITPFIFTLSFFALASAQTILSAGDVAIVGVNCDNPDDFAFLLLTDIETGTVIKFTDNGWLAAGGFRGGEGLQAYTAPSLIPEGTVIIFSESAVNFSGSGTFSLSTSGDQLLCYQGDESNPVMLYGINIAGAGVWQDDATSTNNSALPAGLINGETAVAVQEFDNVKFGGSTSFSSPFAALLSIGNLTNWVGDDANRYDFNIFGDFSLPVQLSSFTARAGDGQVILKWITESEQGNVGFEIMRAMESDGDYILLSSYRFDERLRGQLNSNIRTTYQLADEEVINGQTYWYKLIDVDLRGARAVHGPLSATPCTAGRPVVNQGVGDLPQSFNLLQNYPNPFNSGTTLSFTLPFFTNEPVVVDLRIYNTLGEEVDVLFQGEIGPGNYAMEWDASAVHDGKLSSGIYYAVFRAGYYTGVIRMVYMK